jgi:hypothetical protein
MSVADTHTSVDTAARHAVGGAAPFHGEESAQFLPRAPRSEGSR